MKRLFLTIAVVLSLTGCQKLPTPICYGEAIIGGQETVIPIYAVKRLTAIPYTKRVASITGDGLE